jgi:hypothetical protein
MVSDQGFAPDRTMLGTYGTATMVVGDDDQALHAGAADRGATA